MSPIGSSQNPETLWRDAREGDENAFREMYRQTQGPLFRYLRRMGLPEGQAEEVVQESYFQLLRRPEGFDPALGSLQGYLLGVARRIAWRQWGDRETVEFVPEIAAEDNPEEHAGSRQRQDAVRRAVATLPAHYREAVVLCEMENLSYEQAAEAMGCPVGTVRSRLFRAKEILMARLEPVMASRRTA
jgi:RNA polymerase sigma-70 factor (ECF subfamily)